MSLQDVASIANLTLESVTDQIPENLITSDSLASQFTNTRSKRVSNRLFRIVQQIALAAADSRYVPLDGGALPRGSAAKWLAGGVTPTVISTATSWTELTALVGVKVDEVAIQNVVTKNLASITEMMKNWEDIGLHTDGTGTLATLSGAPSGKVVALSPTPFGARNIEIGQTVDIVNPTGNVTRGSLTVDNKNAFLGSQQTFSYVGNDVAGATTSDIVRYGGLTDGVPKWLNGLKYLVSYSTAGELHGIPRSTPQVVANGFDMGGSLITRSALMLLLSQRRARIDEKKIPKDFWYTHDTQIQAYKEIGYTLQRIDLDGGKAAGFDPFFRDGVSIEGKKIAWGQHADQQSWYLLAPSSIGRVKFSEPYFPTVNGSRVWNTYNQNGTANLEYVSAYLNPIQYFTDLAPANGVVTGCGGPSGFISAV